MNLLFWMQSIHNPVLDVFFNSVTYLGDEITVVLVMAWCLWCGNRKLGTRLGLSFFVAGLSAQLLKMLCMIPRPWVRWPELVPGDLAREGASGWSFPSGHTMAATVLFVTLFLYFEKRSHKALCLTALALVAVSRMYLLVHTLQDVLASLMLGAAISILNWYCAEGTRRWPWYAALGGSLLLGGLLIGLAVWQLSRGGIGSIDSHGYGSLGKALGASVGFFAGLSLMGKRPPLAAARLPQKLIRMLVGLAVAGICMFGLPLLLGDSVVVEGVSYCVLALWAVAVYPALLLKWKGKRPSGEV